MLSIIYQKEKQEISKQSEIITYQPKCLKPKHCWYKINYNNTSKNFTEVT